MSEAKVVTLPNAISFVRLLMVPLFLWLLLGPDEVAWAGWLLGLIASTDWIDGYLARRLDQVSEVGKFLDPLADRLAIVAALIGGMVADVLPVWFGVALLVREGLIAIGALVLGTRAGAKLEVRKMGKLATLLLYASIAWLFVGKGTPFDPLVWAAWIVGIPGLILYYFVGFQYFSDARRILTAERSGRPSTG